MSLKEIAEVLCVAPSTINYHTGRLGLRGKTSLKLSEEQCQYIIDNYKTDTYTNIGKVVGLTPKQVEGWVRNHIPTRGSKRRIFNDGVFDIITTPEQAYWLGFIYADGWISIFQRGSGSDRLNYEFGMELKFEDRYILEKLNDFLGGVHTVKDMEKHILIANNERITHTKTSILRVFSKNIVLGLKKNGIDTHKTYSKTFPIVSDELFPDFLRGYIDGDGCIHKMKENHLAIHITSANNICLEYIKSKLEKMYGVVCSIYKEEVSGYKDKYRLYCFRNEDVRKLLDIIYYSKASIKLERKYKIYCDYYGLGA